MVIIKKISGISPDKRLVTLDEHNCFITLICLKHFLKPRKDRYIFLLNGYFVKIKNEHGNVHLNYFLFQNFTDANITIVLLAPLIGYSMFRFLQTLKSRCKISLGMQ